MKKKFIFIIIACSFLYLQSGRANTLEKRSIYKFEMNEPSQCADWADYVAGLAEARGGNYYQVWFAAYASCIG
jgi:hypothetical protein